MDEENVYTSPTEERVYTSPSPEEPPVKTKKKKKEHRFLRVLALILVCVLLGGAAGVGGTVLMHKYYADHTELSEEAQRVAALVGGRRDTAITATAQVDTDRLLTASQVYAANVASTVGIRTSISSTNFWGYRTTSAAAGSGFIVTENGYVLTNYHVVEGSDSITVSTYDGTDYPATVVGYDASNDIAVLKLEATGLTPVVLGSSKALSVGEDVVAIGNPMGELTFSLTRGIVSALEREVTFSDGLSMKLIQTDCSINAGNSGGALFNMYGEVVGITNAKYSSSTTGASIDNIGFAIPIDSVRTIFQSIIEKGYVSKPYLGVSVADVTEESKAYGLPSGVAVQEVVEDGPAAKAGMQVYDIITAANGTPIEERSQLADMVSASKPGDVFTLDIYRQGQRLTLRVTVEEQIQEAQPKQEAVQQMPQQQLPQQGGGEYFFSNPFDFFNMLPW